jgi:hypothetical protein
MELAGKGVKVTTVNPGPVKTNFFQMADPEGNYQANVARWMIEPEYVARKVVEAIGKNRREINLPFFMGAGARLYQVFPTLVEKALGRWINKK